jgi:hypothetical protein
MQRPISDTWFISIKTATRALISACNGIVAAGEIALASKSEVARWYSPTDPALIPLAAVLALEAVCDKPFVTAAMATLHGQRLTPEASGNLATLIARQQAKAMQHSADMLAHAADALTDGKISVCEAAQIDRAAADLQRAIDLMRRTLAQVQGALAGGAR